jgi:hypothetical protein
MLIWFWRAFAGRWDRDQNSCGSNDTGRLLREFPVDTEGCAGGSQDDPEETKVLGQVVPNCEAAV